MQNNKKKKGERIIKKKKKKEQKNEEHWAPEQWIAQSIDVCGDATHGAISYQTSGQ